MKKISMLELNILLALTQGMTNKEIAKSQHIAEQSVKTVINSVYEKFGVTNRVEAAVFAVKNGWI